MTKITINLNVQVEGGPSIPSSLSREVKAYDYIDTVIPSDGKVLTVKLQPSENKDLEFVLIQVSGDFEKEKVTYGGDNGDEIILNETHIYLGQTNIKPLGDPVNELKFKNASTPDPKKNKDAKLKILVGRNPTPTPTP